MYICRDSVFNLTGKVITHANQGLPAEWIADTESLQHSEGISDEITKGSVDRNKVIFGNLKRIKIFRRDIEEIKSHLSRDTRKSLFQESSYDTKDNFHGAILILKKDLGSSPTRNIVEERVLAMHFISLSSHGDIGSYLEILKGLISSYKNSKINRVRYSLLWDISDISKISARDAYEKTREFAESIENLTIRGQIKLAMENVRNENS